jgi:hypothetical protein
MDSLVDPGQAGPGLRIPAVSAHTVGSGRSGPAGSIRPLPSQRVTLPAKTRKLCKQILRWTVVVDLIGKPSGTSSQLILSSQQGGLFRLRILGQ